MNKNEKQVITSILKDYLEVLYTADHNVIFDALFGDKAEELKQYNLDQEDRFDLEKEKFIAVDLYTSEIRSKIEKIMK